MTTIDRRRKRRHDTKPRIVDRYLEPDKINTVLAALNQYTVNDAQRVKLSNVHGDRRTIMQNKVAYSWLLA